ncbi:nuclear transport factor 2 family protein [Novosphingobium sp. YJ-S2-02]|uniref:Nuclear transport factor 2 family protein n=1 Tax=Novosphingobium aureum TaxID=2792964 RepID=A0A931MJN1_9SPHN|nr:nuclear transport factor 2 family protein [Novosphingobium aureum]MBH0111893.1 nuclear transport factor 2 family protein [Novosphingobium aureum]
MSVPSDLAGLVERLTRLEAESAIRAVMARYMEICDTLGPDSPMAELGALFTREAVWTGVGARYAGAFGGHGGREAIVAMLAHYQGEPGRRAPHFAMNAHFLSSETIRVAGESARGQWMMLQTSTYADGRSDLRSARLNVAFAFEEGAWRIARFETENLFSRPVDRWDDPAPVTVPDQQTGE